ncbi:unnamed protein product [Vitrella brassicaformis CCMP3155]|uniref:Uncharacterized protein n=2 Tax=Vitrella brassicaformis TaxID=1169539 RepID=A0A0G4EQA8_VITBC|nr:unnamed protein product [Vitrella brassicaformis CCMP3155]|eukprot:CEL99609.1 unnamed protein product [Vitrella brassicaformis CCMP3155]
MKRGFLSPKAEQRAAAAASTAEESVSPQRKRKARPPPRVSAAIKRQFPHLEHACGRPLLLLQASLGPSLFLTPTPAKARCLVIDFAHRNTRRMWEAVSLEVAYQWGMAAVTLEKLVVRYPKPAVSRRERSNAPMWCMGVWVAILEGHAHGRQQAIAVKNKADKRPGDTNDLIEISTGVPVPAELMQPMHTSGVPLASALPALGHNTSQPSGVCSRTASAAASNGSLRVLEFEAVDIGGPQEWERGDGDVAPSSQPLPPKTDGAVPPRILPVHLPALTEEEEEEEEEEDNNNNNDDDSVNGDDNGDANAVTSSQPLPPKTDGGVPPRILPVYLPALTEVRNMPVEVANVRMDRSWHTPQIKVLTFTKLPTVILSARGCRR